MDQRRIIGAVVAVIILLLLLTCCCRMMYDYLYKDRELTVVKPTPIPTVPTEERVTFDLASIKPQVQECASVYDFDLAASGCTIYGLAVLYKDRVYLLLNSEDTISEVTWAGGEVSQSSGPPSELEMEIDGANGTEYWYELPSAATDGGEITIVLP